MEFIALCVSRITACGLSKTGPYKLGLICEPLGSWATEFLTFLCFRNCEKYIAKIKTRKNLKLTVVATELNFWIRLSTALVFSVRNAMRFIKLRNL